MSHTHDHFIHIAPATAAASPRPSCSRAGRITIGSGATDCAPRLQSTAQVLPQAILAVVSSPYVQPTRLLELVLDCTGL